MQCIHVTTYHNLSDGRVVGHPLEEEARGERQDEEVERAKVVADPAVGAHLGGARKSVWVAVSLFSGGTTLQLCAFLNFGQIFVKAPGWTSLLPLRGARRRAAAAAGPSRRQRARSGTCPPEVPQQEFTQPRVPGPRSSETPLSEGNSPIKNKSQLGSKLPKFPILTYSATWTRSRLLEIQSGNMNPGFGALNF